jgi:hypothetical protein
MLFKARLSIAPWAKIPRPSLRLESRRLIAIISLTRSGYTLPRAAEKPRQIEQYTINTPRGPIAVTEIRSGTEFNRLLQLPDGQSIAEDGRVNNWGERQIDMIGGTDSK